MNLSVKKITIIVFSLSVAIASATLAYVYNIQTNDVQYQASKIMESVPLHCYLFYPNLKDKQVNSVELTYYKDIGLALNNTMKYPDTFMRSAVFHAYLIQNCPYLNQTKNVTPPVNFQPSLAIPNTSKTIGEAWKFNVQNEQLAHEYNYGPPMNANTDNYIWNIYANYYNDNLVNPKHFDRIEDGASAFNMPVSEFADQLFLPWNHVLDVNTYQNVTSTTGKLFGSDFIGCKNPSWRANSDIRQCNLWNSHWVINAHTQQLMGILDPPPMNATQSHA